MNSENKIQLNYLSKLIEFNNKYLEEYYRVLKESLNKEINILRCKQCNFIFDSGDQYKIISSKKNNPNNLDLKIQCLKCNKKFTNSLNNLQ